MHAVGTSLFGYGALAEAFSVHMAGNGLRGAATLTGDFACYSLPEFRSPQRYILQ
jgi:hypothetical protein